MRNYDCTRPGALLRELQIWKNSSIPDIENWIQEMYDLSIFEKAILSTNQKKWLSVLLYDIFYYNF